jgi:hypothetical protein
MVGFPLLLIPIALYNAIAFLMPTVSVSDKLFSLTLVSGAEWPVTLSDVLLALGVFLLLLEVIKGARPGAKYLTDHLLSLIVFGGAAFEFVMWPKFASSTFFLLTLLAMTDFLTGVALRTRHRSRPVTAAVPAPAVEEANLTERTDATPAAEPRFERPSVSPVAAAQGTAPSVPEAASVAESDLMDHPKTKIAQPLAAAREPSSDFKNEPPAVAKVEPMVEPKIPSPEPKIPSPELQPGDGTQEQ